MSDTPLVVLRQGEPTVIVRDGQEPLIVEREVTTGVLIESSGTTIEYYDNAPEITDLVAHYRLLTS